MGGKGAEVSGKEKSLRRHALKNRQITERKKTKLETTPQLSLSTLLLTLFGSVFLHSDCFPSARAFEVFLIVLNGVQGF